MIDYRFGKEITLESAAEIFMAEFREEPEFKEATVRSILSAIKELKHSQSDRKVAEAIAERLFGGK